MVHCNTFVVSVLSLVLLGPLGLQAGSDDTYREEMDQFRQRREAGLKAEDGWLSVVGLHWLHHGEQKLGSDPGCDILLPARAPAVVGSLTLASDKAEFRPAAGVRIMKGGAPFGGGEIRSDADGKPDVLEADGIRLIVLKRGSRYALRVKDSQSEARASFGGLRWYPVNEDWRITAKFVPAPSQTKLIFDTIVGEQDVTTSPGYVVFERDGKTYKLQSAGEPDGSLWLVFRDGTSGRTTHGGARQLIVPAPQGDTVVLDFNKTVNLPCAYIPFATCPLAPPQNRLGLAITAGELKYEPAASKPARPDFLGR